MAVAVVVGLAPPQRLVRVVIASVLQPPLAELVSAVSSIMAVKMFLVALAEPTRLAMQMGLVRIM